jgi:hypothetical protein
MKSSVLFCVLLLIIVIILAVENNELTNPINYMLNCFAKVKLS